MLSNLFLHFIIGQTREVDLKVEMGQTAEKLYGADEKYKKLELERNDLKRRYLKIVKISYL